MKNKRITRGLLPWPVVGGFSILKRGLTMLPGVPGTFPGPLSAQIQTVEGCNGLCTMCPNTVRSSAAGRTIREELYLDILEQLSSMGSLNYLHFQLHNEPLLDPHLCRRVSQARALLGDKVTLSVTSNGVLLTEDLAASLAEGGLDGVQVSLDALTPGTYAAVRPGLDMKLALEGVEASIRAGLHVRVRFVRQKANESEEREFLNYWRSRGVEVLISRLTNRAGDLKSFSSLRVRSSPSGFEHAWDLLAPVMPSCVAPFLRMIILIDGRVLFCCHDWKDREVIGDLTRDSVSFVWRGELARKGRAALWTSKKKGPPLCRDCSVRQPFSRR